MYRICVVEDEIKIQKELKLLLENANYEVARCYKAVFNKKNIKTIIFFLNNLCYTLDNR